MFKKQNASWGENISGARIWVTGHNGLVGGNICEILKTLDCEVFKIPRAELDLTRQSDVEEVFNQLKPDIVINAAALVGGIEVNRLKPAEFAYQNMMIGANLVHNAARIGVSKFVNLGSSCIYPRLARQPAAESSLLTGALEPTNEGYAIGKISTLKLCQFYRQEYGLDFITAIPTNLYGPGDNFSPTYGHVIPAFMYKFYNAIKNNEEKVTFWGTGTPVREFLYIKDAAEALVHLTLNYSDLEPINVSGGQSCNIFELAEKIRHISGYQGEIVWDEDKPDGMPRKALDSTKIEGLGWKPAVDLDTGLRETWSYFLSKIAEG
ncbi:GDP-L-fucose synthase family protein [Curvivirga sp.]|uniref:GDP-L-fucose synthase family protein n=1 Tax=Curvivirga sp. TaxID=2856848 RepID=UPI003B5936B5